MKRKMFDKDNPVHKGMVLTLNDDDGNSVDYTLMDIIDYDGHTYVYFIRSDQVDQEEQELYITEYEETYQDIIFNSITNEVLLNELYDIFMEENGYTAEEYDDGLPEAYSDSFEDTAE